MKLRIIGVILGGLAGFGYYYFIGCSSGTCAITSNPWISTMYGSLVGIVLAWPNKNQKSTESDSDTPPVQEA